MSDPPVPDPWAEPTPAARPAIGYAPAEGGVSRRAFRSLFVLTLLNTILLAGYVLGPVLIPFSQQQWAAYQKRQADRKTAVATAAFRTAAMAAEKTAMNYAGPTGALVYDETPRTTATSPMPQWPAATSQPAEYLALPVTVPGWGMLVKKEFVVLLMHRRQAVGGGARFVFVFANTEDMRSTPNTQGHGLRSWIALTFDPTTPMNDLRLIHFDSYVETSRERSDFAAPPPAKPVLRMYAGRADPGNAAKFTIPYDLDGTPGTIHGELLANDRIDLQPDGPLAARWSTR